jgi:hypothetical protein
MNLVVVTDTSATQCRVLKLHMGINLRKVCNLYEGNSFVD